MAQEKFREFKSVTPTIDANAEALLKALDVDVHWAARRLFVLAVGKRVVMATANYHEVTIGDLLRDTRREVAAMRWTAMAAMKRYGLSTPEIAERLGMRDHTTVMHGLRKVRASQDMEAQARDIFESSQVGGEHRDAA